MYPWICIANHGFISFWGSQILTFIGSICALQNESGFGLYCGSQILNFSKDSVCGFELETDFEQIWPIFTNPKNPHESLVYRRTMNKSKSIHILCFRFTNLYPVQKICFVLLCSKDSFCGFNSTYGVQTIHFMDLFQEKNSKITQFVSIWKDLHTNPATLFKTLKI